MLPRFKIRSVLLGVVWVLGVVTGARAEVTPAGGWVPFLAHQDLVWTSPPTGIQNAPFVGNGILGLTFMRADDTTLAFKLGSTEVEDRRDIKFGRSRLIVGEFTLKTVGKITGANLRLDLWNAEVTGTVTTAKGEIGVRILAHANEPVIAIELTPSIGEPAARLVWQPGFADSLRIQGALTEGKFRNDDERKAVAEYPRNPKPVVTENLCVQALEQGGYTTAWKATKDAGATRYLVSTAYGWGEPVAAITARAEAAVTRAAAAPVLAWTEAHRAWWHAYYARSFVSIPDSYWESFYWIQLYKFASASRASSPVLDHNGPWVVPTPWGGTWWNLNVQLTYWLPVSSNHIDEADSLRRALVTYKDNLTTNLPEAWRADSAAIARATGHDLVALDGPKAGLGGETGNLTWALHNVWLHYRVTMDDRMLREDLFPLLRRAVNFYLHQLTTDSDGRLHTPRATSPEYDAGTDTNYDLSLLRWALQTLLWSDTRLKLNDPLRATWTATLAKLADYPQDAAQGYLIAAGMPYAYSHRHYSHLLMIYPLYLVNNENGGTEIIKKSISHWQSMPEKLQGYSFSGSSSLYSAIGDGDAALRQLNGLRRFVRANTMYFEGPPVMETPFSAGQSIHDMLLQSWSGPSGDPVLRIFPAVPAAWSEATFADWRAEGAFLVSAHRRAGKTQWVTIKSLAGERCLVRPGLDGEPRIIAGPTDGRALKSIGGGVYEIPLKAGEEVTLIGETMPTDFRLRVSRTEEPRFRFGSDAASPRATTSR